MTYRAISLITLIFGLACGQLLTPQPQPDDPLAGLPTATARSTPIPTVTRRPTATPKPATPSATPTPTVTPTPIIYSIQPGDTLLSIAIDFGLPVDVIQTANGIIDPRLLQIGQVLIIPEPETEAGQVTPTPTPYPVTVRGLSFQRTAQGGLWAFGEVFNPSDTWLSEIVVEVSLFDSEGRLLAAKAVYTQLDVLLPNEQIPFAVLFDDPPTTFAQYQATTISAVPILGQTRYYVDLEPLQTSVVFVENNTYRIRGQLENTGEADVEAIRLVATAYDEADRVLAQRQATLAVVVLRRQARTSFEIDLVLPEGSIDHYAIQAQGLRSQ